MLLEKNKCEPIYNWVDEYKNKFEQLHSDNIEKKINELLKEANINLNDNVKKTKFQKKDEIKYDY
ncbi:hypothetical protein [Mesomycoplasma neurolyticum]|uniref:Uncharacterized protein n=1 Tax=Mesomycoplasma neurolyticum TaxID=2120 RepID=A0A449A4J6_9BACT|nr:hypothetical protein [Mesomycoplasma neurolyticum]VEU59159.1 Uncharacterised protein [Mesomycoplasma neurolyticum]